MKDIDLWRHTTGGWLPLTWTHKYDTVLFWETKNEVSIYKKYITTGVFLVFINVMHHAYRFYLLNIEFCSYYEAAS